MRLITASDFGKLVLASRKAAKLTQRQLAAVSNLGERFIRELEHGKPTCQLEKSLRVALMLGMKIEVTSPFDIDKDSDENK